MFAIVLLICITAIIIVFILECSYNNIWIFSKDDDFDDFDKFSSILNQIEEIKEKIDDIK